MYALPLLALSGHLKRGLCSDGLAISHRRYLVCFLTSAFVRLYHFSPFWRQGFLFQCDLYVGSTLLSSAASGVLVSLPYQVCMSIDFITKIKDWWKATPAVFLEEITSGLLHSPVMGCGSGVWR